MKNAIVKSFLTNLLKSSSQQRLRCSKHSDAALAIGSLIQKFSRPT